MQCESYLDLVTHGLALARQREEAIPLNPVTAFTAPPGVLRGADTLVMGKSENARLTYIPVCGLRTAQERVVVLHENRALPGYGSPTYAITSTSTRKPRSWLPTVVRTGVGSEK